VASVRPIRSRAFAAREGYHPHPPGVTWHRRHPEAARPDLLADQCLYLGPVGTGLEGGPGRPVPIPTRGGALVSDSNVGRHRPDLVLVRHPSNVTRSAFPEPGESRGTSIVGLARNFQQVIELIAEILINALR
jgi:hypothetical protein